MYINSRQLLVKGKFKQLLAKFAGSALTWSPITFEMHQSQHPAYWPLPFGADYFILYMTEMESDLPQLESEHGLISLHSGSIGSARSRSCICLQETHQSERPCLLAAPIRCRLLHPLHDRDGVGPDTAGDRAQTRSACRIGHYS